MLAASGFLFGTVIVVVCVLGVLGGVLSLRRSGTRRSGSGSLWFFRGQSDSAPVHAPGARSEDRHVIDPSPPDDAPHD